MRKGPSFLFSFPAKFNHEATSRSKTRPGIASGRRFPLEQPSPGIRTVLRTGLPAREMRRAAMPPREDKPVLDPRGPAECAGLRCYPAAPATGDRRSATGVGVRPVRTLRRPGVQGVSLESAATEDTLGGDT